MDTNKSSGTDNDNSQNKIEQEKPDAAIAQSLADGEKQKEKPAQNSENDSKKNKQTKLQIFFKSRLGLELNNEVSVVDAVGMLIGIIALFLVLWQSCQLQEGLKLSKESFNDAKISGEIASKQAERSTIATEKSADALTIQAKIADETARISNRAYISVNDVKQEISEIEEKFIVNVIFVNNGRTPAYDIHAFRDGKIGGTGVYEHEINAAQEMKDIENLSIGASNSFIVRIVIEDSLSRRRIKDIINGKTDLFIHGKCTYIDIFGAKHFTRFCFIYRWKLKAFDVFGKYNDAN